MLQTCTVLNKSKSTCVLCPLSPTFYFIGDKISAQNFKDEISPSLKTNDWLKISQDVALNNAGENRKLRSKLSYKVLKEEDG